MLKLYNTLTRKTEVFEPLNPSQVTYYSCGPTVYDYAHIGHARTYVFADILERTLEFAGYKVKRVMNITDVGHLTSDADWGEDKMEKGARREKKTVWQIAEFYTNDFMEMAKSLNIKTPQIVCKATDHIRQMIELIKKLEQKGFTYRISDGIYFDTLKLKDYGKLTGQAFEELAEKLKAGARIEIVSGKKNITDFALWKLTEEGVNRQMEWDSPWGRGFPGWHIECSAMSMKYLGETIDIHTGGVDHIRIHHTNEIAQSEAATGKPFARYFLHAGHLLLDNCKMSKSLDNFLRVADLEKKGYNALALRYLFLTAHYRKQMNFTFKALDASQTALEKLKAQISNIKKQLAKRKPVSLADEKLRKATLLPRNFTLGKINKLRGSFTKAINNDLNTPQGLSILWQVTKSNLRPQDKYELILLFDEVLGFKLDKLKVKSEKLKVPKRIMELVKEREVLRQEKKWPEADKIREKIKDRGYEIEDMAEGPEIKLKIQN